jgi:hypothetical protein
MINMGQVVELVGPYKSLPRTSEATVASLQEEAQAQATEEEVALVGGSS